MSPVINLIVLSSFFLTAFAVGEIAYRKFNVEAEITRKWSHISSGFLALLFPFYFNDVFWVVLICTIFGIFLFVCKKFKFLPSINSVERKTHGSILFPLAVIISFIAFEMFDNLIYYYLPVLTLAICDLCAAIIGKRYPIKKIKIYLETKSLGGLLAFVISFILLSIAFNFMGFSLSLLFILATGIFSGIIELISPRGLDNVSIPLSVILFLYLFIG